MYVEIVPNRNSRPTILLREGWREGKKVCKRTLANLTDWPARKVELLRRVLKEEPLVSPTEAFCIERSLPHGHVEAVLETIKRIGLDKLIGACLDHQVFTVADGLAHCVCHLQLLIPMFVMG